MNLKGINNYIIVFLFLAISGNPFFCYWTYSSLALLILVFIFLYKFRISLLYDNLYKIRKYILLFSILFLLQIVFVDSISVITQINYLIKIIVASLIFLYYKDRFSIPFLRVMTFIAFVSLIFYPLSLLGFNLPNIFGTGFANNTNTLHTIIVYNYVEDFNFGRNCGMFWEPGVFACYLCTVPLLNLGNLNTFVNSNKYSFIILAIALFTTFSTTGYLISLIFIYKYSVVKFKYIGWILALIAIAFIVSTDVIVDKFNKDLATIEGLSFGEKYYYDGYNTENRLGAIFFLSGIIMNHPLIGNGLNPEALYSHDKSLLLLDHIGIGNGFFLYIASLGILGLVFYISTIYKNWNIDRGNKILSILVIVLLLQGEPLLIYPLYIGLPFFIHEKEQKLKYLIPSKNGNRKTKY